MKGLNKVYLIGHVGALPTLTETASGKVLCKFQIATPSSTTNSDGTYSESTEWHAVTAWGKEARYLCEYATKGSTLAIEAKLTPHRWTDKESKTHLEVGITVERILWLQQSRRNPTDPPPPSEAP